MYIYIYSCLAVTGLICPVNLLTKSTLFRFSKYAYTGGHTNSLSGGFGLQIIKESHVAVMVKSCYTNI